MRTVQDEFANEGEMDGDEFAIGWGELHFDWPFSARSHPFLTKWISRLRSPRPWLSGGMFGSVGRC